MDELEKIEENNKKFIDDLRQLAGTEDSRVSVIATMFMRRNNDMRVQNIQEIKKDISYGAKDFGLLPDKYSTNMDSIVKAYIEETNKFMKYYNDEFINIQNILQNAEEKQKYYFFKLKEANIIKRICILAEKEEESYIEITNQIKQYKKNLGLYEKIIARCDKEFEDCKNRREQDFQELFEIKQEQSLVVIQKRNPFIKFILKIKNKFKGYENFSRIVLQKHAKKINNMKVELMELYSAKIKNDIENFSNQINEMING